MLVCGIGECVSGSCSNGHWLWIISLEQLWKLERDQTKIERDQTKLV